MRRGRVLTAVLAATLLVAACGDDDDDVSSDTATSVTTTTEATDTTGTTAGDSTSVPDGTSGALPGERIDIFPYEGAELAVVGVAHDDTLNVREGPGVEFDVVTELAPTAQGFTATGHVRDIGAAFWTEVEVREGSDDVTGWVNVRFVAQFGATDDIRAELESSGGLPTAGSVLELGMAVAERRASDEPESDIVVVVAPSTGDLGEVTIDVIGLGDDAVGGERLHVFAASEDGGRTYYVKSAERTVMCTRGVSDDGLCL